MNINVILVAIDFSECAGAAFKMAKALAQQFGAKLVLLHVIHQRHVERLAEFTRKEPEALIAELRQQAQRQLSDFLARYQTDGLEVESLVAVGLPFQEIAGIARDLAVDLIALGGYGRSGKGPIENVFFGSTSEKVVRLLPCPVLCVPLEYGK